MNDEPRDDAPLSPSASAGSEGMPLRWIIGAFAVGLLLLGGYKGVQWLEANRDTLLRAGGRAPARPPRWPSAPRRCRRLPRSAAPSARRNPTRLRPISAANPRPPPWRAMAASASAW